MNTRGLFIDACNRARLSIEPCTMDVGRMCEASTACIMSMASAMGGGRSTWSGGRDSPSPTGAGARAVTKQRKHEERMRKEQKRKREKEEKRQAREGEKRGQEGKRKGKKGKRARGKRKKR